MKKTFYFSVLLVFLTSLTFSSCNTDNPVDYPSGNSCECNKDDSTTKPGDNSDNNDDNNDNNDDNPNLGGSSVDGALSGLFSVNANGKQVRFSQGNLQYTQSTDTWSFANQQYEILGEKNLKNTELTSDDKYGQNYEGTGLADKIDLFGWSGSTGAKWGVSTSTDWSYYSGDFVDWGRNPISNGGNKSNLWRTLTYDEWFYLRWERIDYDKLISVAQVAGVNGLILLPDNWILPAGLSFKSGFADEYSAYAYAPYQSYTSVEWSRMESAGAVFLPASGFRHGALISYLGYGGDCWSATPDDESGAGFLYFHSHEAGMNWNYRNFGPSVRLVQDLH